MALCARGETTKITTIEQAHYWLKRKWPVADRAHEDALCQVEAAMDCLVPMTSARQAFLSAAGTAGFGAEPGAAAGEQPGELPHGGL